MNRTQRRLAAKKAPPPRATPISVTEDTRRWIAENLLLGATPELIAQRLQQRGCPLMLALEEIRLAQSSPYLQGADVLKQRLGKRDWILDSLGRLAVLEGGMEAVPVAEGLEADAFFRDYYATNRPVLISGLLDAWPAAKLWSLDYFEDLVGDASVEVQAGRESNAAYEMESPNHRRLMPVREVLALLRSGVETNDFYVTANNGGHNRDALARLWEDVGPIPGYLDPKAAQDGFFWMGPKGTVTPFHHDLTNNLLVQIRGAKAVTLVPSWDTAKMRNFRHCYSAFDGPEALAALPEAERPTVLRCTIEEGQALFIPVGWWHHVVGLDTTIGMSFTNFVRDNDFYSAYSFYDAL